MGSWIIHVEWIKWLQFPPIDGNSHVWGIWLSRHETMEHKRQMVLSFANNPVVIHTPRSALAGEPINLLPQHQGAMISQLFYTEHVRQVGKLFDRPPVGTNHSVQVPHKSRRFIILTRHHS